jgi:hypothetical protein
MKRKTKRRCGRKIDGRWILDADKWIGPIKIPKYEEPVFVSDGSGNGWLVGTCGIRRVYIR